MKLIDKKDNESLASQYADGPGWDGPLVLPVKHLAFRTPIPIHLYYEIQQ